MLYDLLIVLNYLYEAERHQCGAGSTPTVTVVRLQFDIVEKALSTILVSSQPHTYCVCVGGGGGAPLGRPWCNVCVCVRRVGNKCYHSRV